MADQPEIKPFNDFSAAARSARFHRADLHVHSFGVSADVNDEAMLPATIVKTAIDRDVALLAITDHNAVDAVPAAIKEGTRQGLSVLAGVELSTAEGHLLAFFDPDDLKRFTSWFNGLDFQEDEATGDRWLLEPMHQIAKGVAEAGGLAIPAHVLRDKSGAMTKAPIRSLEALIAGPHIAGLEIDGPAEFDIFGPADKSDGSSDRKAMLRRRTEALGPVAGPRLPKLYFSDSHSLLQIARNRDGDERLTRIKMTEPSWDGLRRALQDPGARIRLEETLPDSYPRLIGARFIGGFLDGQEIAFSSNLTCLIGGRGAGKSTVLEAVRCACLGVRHDREHDSASGWPDTVQLIYQDAFGERHYLERSAGGETVARIGDEAVPMTVAVEGYDQDRIAEIIRGYRKEPDLLGNFLDAFVDLGPVNGRIADLRTALERNAQALAPLADAGVRKEAGTRSLGEAQVKLQAIEKTKLKAALEWQRLLAKERALRESIVARLAEIKEGVRDVDVTVDTAQLISNAEINDIATMPGKDLLQGTPDESGLVSMVEGLETSLRIWRDQGENTVATALAAIEPRIAQWRDYERRVEARIAEVAQELRDQGVNPNMAELNRLTTQEAEAKQTIREADADLARIVELRRERTQLVKDYQQQQAGRFYLRAAATQRLTDDLNESLETFKVKIGFRQGSRVEDYEQWLRSVLGQRIFKASRPAELCRGIHPVDLANAIRKKQSSTLTGLRDVAGNPFFGKSDADEFIASVSPAQVDELEAIEVSDLPEITLTTEIEGEIVPIAFENLSFGQKASILLGALLFSEDDKPLIIDQPEDHLDSAFISQTVVATLRRVKEQRQVILATHNANIAVLGDAELIVPLQGYAGKGIVRDAGSVDARDTSKRACAILEGGEGAYLRRGEMYGLVGS